MVEKNIPRYFESYLDELKRQKGKVAFLQLTGKIEEFLVKEFMYHVYTRAGQKIFCLQNLGNRGEPRIDICFLKDKVVIWAMVEAKYFRNIHRYWEPDNAKDEVSSGLKDLGVQIRYLPKATHSYDYKVNLSSPIYGLVFASFAKCTKDDGEKDKFYEFILTKAEGRFKHHDLSRPAFNSVYEDVPVKVLDKCYYVSLRAGLWTGNK